MWTEELDTRWHELAEEVLLGIKEWRLQHPTASLREIEQAIDERWAKARARILQDAALVSAARTLTTIDPGERPRCPDCDRPLEARGQEVRQLTTQGDRTITLTRSAAVCPACGWRIFPPG